MPDVTSTLLAMYQQIIGGSSAREQASLEAECARRIITSGLTIAGSGAVTLPGNLTIGGTLAVNNFSVTGTFTVPGLLTVGTLSVTGSATVSGTLGVSGLLTATAGLTVSGGPLTSGGNCVVAGLLQVSGFGTHTVSAGGTGAHILTVQNVTAGTGNSAQVTVGNDTAPSLGALQVFASTFTPVAHALPNGVALVSSGSNGLTLSAASAFLRVLTGASTERLRVLATGEVLINQISPVGGGQLQVALDGTAHVGLSLQNLNPANTGVFLAFYNSASASIGSISQSGASSVLYNTTSDARLKEDLGRAEDLSALRRVVIHDFQWKGDGTRARGVFAQEAARVFPRAITIGADETTKSGDLRRPWQTDYSQFVPDLIAGWQQHDAELAVLRRRLQQDPSQPQDEGEGTGEQAHQQPAGDGLGVRMHVPLGVAGGPPHAAQGTP